MKMSTQQRDYDYLYRLVLIGDSNSGKTHLLELFGNEKNPGYSMVGLGFQIRYVNVDGAKVKVEIWDIPERDRYVEIHPTYYNEPHGVFLVYNTANVLSFEDLRFALDEVKSCSSEDVVVMLVAYSVDADLFVSIEDAVDFAGLHDLMFVECFWGDEHFAEEAFFKMLRKVHGIDQPDNKDMVQSCILCVPRKKGSR